MGFRAKRGVHEKTLTILKRTVIECSPEMGAIRTIPRWLRFLLAIILAQLLVAILLRSYSAKVRQERMESAARDEALDRNFYNRAPAPLDVRMSISLKVGAGSFAGPADTPSVQRRIRSLGRIPAILVLPGCGFPVWGKDVPKKVAILSVHESPVHLNRTTGVRACIEKNSEAIQISNKQQLDHLVDYVDKADWIDKTRILIAGYGEAAPIVASYSGPAKQRLTLGDPCLVPWKKITDQSPLLMLLTTSPQGLTRNDKSNPTYQVGFEANVEAYLPMVAPCAGLPRPDIPNFAKIITANGKLGVIDRPTKFFTAQRAAYEVLNRAN